MLEYILVWTGLAALAYNLLKNPDIQPPKGMKKHEKEEEEGDAFYLQRYQDEDHKLMDTTADQFFVQPEAVRFLSHPDNSESAYEEFSTKAFGAREPLVTGDFF